MFKKFNRFFIICLALLFISIVLRFISLNLSPLFDTTETRYAGIAQKILLNDDWVTLRMPENNIPFLGKPPLSFWLIAKSYTFLGSNELSARLPNFLMALFTLLFTFLISRKFYDLRTAFFAPLILMSSIFFFIQAGTVNLDMMVCFNLTASIWAYLSIIQNNKNTSNNKNILSKLIYEILLGLFLGLGMLNKGPLAIVLFCGIIVILALWDKNTKLIFKPNWLIIFLIATIISLPWYLAVQAQNADFFDYFFMNEHFYRYLKADYGDRYGSGHHQPHGMSWVFTIGAFMPWSLFLLPLGYSLWENRKQKLFSFSLKILISWFIISPLFFTFARSILMTYMMGSLPPLAILCARTLSKTFYSFKINKHKELSNKFLNFVFNPFNSLFFIGISVIVISAGVISYSAGYPYSMPRLLIMSNTILLAVFAIIIGYIGSKRNLFVLKTLFSLSVISIPLIMSYWYGPLSHSIGDSKSMKSVIMDLKNKIPNYNNEYNISFLNSSAPYSWYFYTREKDIDKVLREPKIQKCFIYPNYNEISSSTKHKNLIIIIDLNLKFFQDQYPLLYAEGLITKEGKYYIFSQENL